MRQRNKYAAKVTIEYGEFTVACEWRDKPFRANIEKTVDEILDRMDAHIKAGLVGAFDKGARKKS